MTTLLLYGLRLSADKRSFIERITTLHYSGKRLFYNTDNERLLHCRSSDNDSVIGNDSVTANFKS